MENYYFITITGVNHYYCKTPFEIDRVLKIAKEPNNEFDGEAIRVELPYIGTVGYVANSENTVFRGTVSAGRLYDHIGDYAYAQVLFVTHSSVIALVRQPEEIENDLHTETDNMKETESKIDESTSVNLFHKPKMQIGF